MNKLAMPNFKRWFVDFFLVIIIGFKLKIIKNLIMKFSLSDSRIRVFRNIIWAVIGKTVNILSGLFVGVLVARYLGPEQYGLMSYVISYVTLFSIIASFGFDNIEIRELAKNNQPKEQILGTALCLRLFLAICTVALIAFSVFLFEADEFTLWMIVIYSFSLILNSFSIIRNYFTSMVNNEYVVKTEIARTTIGAGIKIGLLLLKAPLEWFIIAVTFDFFIVATGYIYSYREKVGSFKQWTFNRDIAVYQIKESFPLLLSGAAIIVYQTVDQIMIRNMIGNAAVGQYVVAAKLAEFIVFIPMIISQTIAPILVKARMDDLNIYEAKRRQFFDIIIWSTVFFSLILSLCAAPLINLLYGDKYFEAIPVLQIVAWKAIFAAMFASSGQIIIIEHKHKLAALRNLIGCFFNILLNLLLIPIMGLTGAAFVSIFTLLITGYLSHAVISPYKFIFHIQTNSIVFGLPRLLRRIFK
ncbi:MAG: flippase [Hydrogenophaga sp.]|nr:flippase [Hydrogenophaga sp.]